MQQLPAMLLIGGAQRNAGKTRLAVALIERFSPDRPVVALKVATIHEAESDAANHHTYDLAGAPFVLDEETDPAGRKDTAQLLAAGARRVHWLRAPRAHLADGLARFLQTVPPGAAIVCESNSLRHVVEPGLFLVVRRAGGGDVKPSSAQVAAHADRVVRFDDPDFDLDLRDISLIPEGPRWALRRPAAAIILAGGRSRRMGRDKSLLALAGQPMIQYIYRQLEPHFRQVLVSTAEPDVHRWLGADIVPDAEPDRGPLMGLACALEASEHDVNFVIACDMPDVDISLVQALLRRIDKHDGAVPTRGDGRHEPLFAVYRKSMLGPIRAALDKDRRKLHALLDRCDVAFVELAPGDTLRNLNTTEDYEQFKRQYDDPV